MSERSRQIDPFLSGPLLLKGGTWWCPDREETMPLYAADTGNTAPVDRPFAIPNLLSAQFDALLGYWNSLRRGNANIPFTDDFSPALLRKMAANFALLRVFPSPQRFRFDLAGANVASVYKAELENQFVDEVSPGAPLDYFAAQCASTVESTAPTLYHHPRTAGAAEYQRLMLPLWGDGRVNAILAVFDFHGASDAI